MIRLQSVVASRRRVGLVGLCGKPSGEELEGGQKAAEIHNLEDPVVQKNDDGDGAEIERNGKN